jgi:hypothetical protein
MIYRERWQPSLYVIHSDPNYALGVVDFGIFWIFNFQQLNLDWQKNFKAKVEKAFSLYSCLPTRTQKREKGSKKERGNLNRVNKKFFCKWVDMVTGTGIKKFEILR